MANKTKEQLEAEAKSKAESGIKMVTIRIPRTRKDEEDVFVSINDRTYAIQRGVEVEVPYFVAEAIRHREEALEEMMLFEEKVNK